MINDGMVHAVKCLPEYFEAVVSGNKTFEVRKADRPYQVGDFIALNEFDPLKGYTRRSTTFRITYVLDDPTYCKDGYVILGLCPLTVSELPF